MDTHCLHPHGLHLTYAQRNCDFDDFLLKYFSNFNLIKKKIAVKENIKNFILCIL